MDPFQPLSQAPGVLLVLAALLGLLVGSFLNVVIYRLPIMLEREWRSQCRELLAAAAGAEAPAPQPSAEQAGSAAPFNLITPRSSCPHCGHLVRAWENVPVLSYLFLKGRCSHCGQPISARYPLVEGVTALATALVVGHFGLGWPALAALFLTWALIALTLIDLDRQLLPDHITQPFLWLGLVLSLFGVFVSPDASILGAVAGYLSLWAVYWLFRLLTHKEGMGYGDFKLLAMLGAWLGWKLLPFIILASSFVGAVVGVALIAVGRHQRAQPLPFGPYLAGAGWLALLWGEELTHSYLRLIGL
jgi:leader peptidase (prepilin peptidase)/N-methyltransferase